MIIGIHHESGSFSDYWIEYCTINHINYKIVNCYSTDIIDQLIDCEILLWHPHHGNYKDNLFAKQLLFALSQSGKTVFPDYHTIWHFDDKIGQKYLLQGIGAPVVKSYVFYSKLEAIKWLKAASFPIVFKLRNGAGSSNVKLVKNYNAGKNLTHKAFGRGFSAFNRVSYFKERLNKFLNGKETIHGVAKGFGRLFIPIRNIKLMHHEKGYVYFQDFIPNNKFDIRVIVIENKGFAIKRMVRNNDFRASGSGTIIHDKNEIDIRCVEIAFEVSKNLNSQCMTFDFVFDYKNTPLIIEISYGFSPSGYHECPGYWDINMNWHEEEFNPYGWMIESLVKR